MTDHAWRREQRVIGIVTWGHGCVKAQVRSRASRSVTIGRVKGVYCVFERQCCVLALFTGHWTLHSLPHEFRLSEYGGFDDGSTRRSKRKKELTRAGSVNQNQRGRKQRNEMRKKRIKEKKKKQKPEKKRRRKRSCKWNDERRNSAKISDKHDAL